MKGIKEETKEKALLKYIEQMIELYNKMSKNKIALVQQKGQPEKENPSIDRCDTVYDREKLAPIIHVPTGRKNPKMKVEEKYDVGSCYVCVYNQQVGLFRQVNWVDPNRDNCITLYKGVDNDNTGIYQSTSSFFGTKQRWLKEGEKATFYQYGQERGEYTATCNMYNAVYFEDVRALMKQEGKISHYALARASREEIEEVLAYAQAIFCSMIENSKNKSFEKFYRR